MENPHRYYVDLSYELWNLKNRMLNEIKWYLYLRNNRYYFYIIQKNQESIFAFLIFLYCF
jgi:hypothetical protein